MSNNNNAMIALFSLCEASAHDQFSILAKSSPNSGTQSTESASAFRPGQRPHVAATFAISCSMNDHNTLRPWISPQLKCEPFNVCHRHGCVHMIY